MGLVGAFDDFGLELRPNARHSRLKLRPLISAIGKEFSQTREPTQQGCKHEHTTIAILKAGFMNHGVQQKTYRVNQDVPFLAFNFLARVVAGWINAGPPFSALFTLWLSITHALGLAARPILSRHFVYSS